MEESIKLRSGYAVGGIGAMFKEFITDIKEMHWAPKLILALVVLKTVATMVREQAIF